MKIINLGILAHADAGKTTLVEHMLFRSGALRAPGTIEKGNTQSDRLAVERERGISVRASSVSLEHGGVRVNIIDTPGHIDFVGEAERALSALDAAVLVVSAAEGIQSQTEIFWRALRRLDIPSIIFLNKIDRMGCDPAAVCASLKEEFTGNIIAVNAAVSPGGRDCYVMPQAASDDDVIALCEADGALAADYLASDGALTTERLTRSLGGLSKSGEAFALLYGSAAQDVGVVELLDAIIEYLPVTEPGEGMAGETVNSTALGVIYKVEHDVAAGKTAYVRLYAGALRNRDAVCYMRRGAYVTVDTVNRADSVLYNKITQIRRITGAKSGDSGMLHGGDSAAVIGLSDARAGDIVIAYKGNTFDVRGGGRDNDNGDGGSDDGSGNSDNEGGSDSGAGCGGGYGGIAPLYRKRLILMDSIRLAEPLFSVMVFAGEGQENKLLQAVREFSDEDPLLEYEWMPDERELVLRVMGKIQLEILETQFMERYGLAVCFSAPTVIYKETPLRPGIGLEEYTMPKPCWAVVQLAIEPLRRGAGYQYESVIKAKTLPYQYQRHVEITVPQALKQGMYNWEVTDIRVTLIGGEHHHVHTHPLDFFLATPIAVMDALRNAGTALLEPFAVMRMTANEQHAGRIIGDITAMRGSFDNPVIRSGNITIEALLPVSESLEYPVRFSSFTSGKGVMKTSFAGYRECPVEFGAVAERRGINPLDRMRWILHKRNALS